MGNLHGFILPAALLVACAAARGADRVDASTLQGKVLIGYQGWFNCAGDGAPENNWRSFTFHR